ncbi:MAG: DUF427 domain-containing protein [Henriciella sp.]|nr:DUF427 domain-containing protein [Henriciella sp.]
MRQHLEPSADHPITIEPKSAPVRVVLAGEVILLAQTYLEMREASYPAVTYLPRDQVDMRHLKRSDHTTWCPYKGEASYFHIQADDGALIENAVWTYETPFPAVAAIKDALAVYPDKVDAIEVAELCRRDACLAIVADRLNSCKPEYVDARDQRQQTHRKDRPDEFEVSHPAIDLSIPAFAGFCLDIDPFISADELV